MPPLRLEDFGSEPTNRTDSAADGEAPATDTPVRNVHDAAALEQARLEGYEAGYQAGWDDAVGQEAQSQGRIGAEFARNLQDLGFTFHEARAHVMQALEPLLAGMVDKVLPRLVSDTLGQTIVEELMPLAADAADQPIQVVVTPESRATLESMLANSTALPFQIVEEATLAEGQVYLRSGSLERHIDMGQVVDRIGAAIQGLYQLNEKALQNG